jgi:aryl-alcohol dehydrogenase-like predicted oxidoreductase
MHTTLWRGWRGRVPFRRMEQRRLGGSGLAVSWVGLGTATWGRDTDEHEAADQIKAFVGAGGSLIDTADTYANGDSERVIGLLLAKAVDRADIVIATKGGGLLPGERQDGRRRDMSRRHLLQALDDSLDRLGVEHVDLWQLHGFDPLTPLDETLSALDTAVATGRARYVGLSNFAGWQTAKAAAWQSAWPGRTALVSTEVEYSLLERGIEREVVPAALDAGLSILPWSPLGRGVLTGKYRTGIPADSRAASDHLAAFVEPYLGESYSRVVHAVCTAAEGLGVSPLATALAWVRDRPGVAAPIVGARTAAQLLGVLAESDIVLPAEIRDALDDVSAPELAYPERGAGQE